MMKFSEIFKQCAYYVKYQEIGENVDYAFVEDGDTLFIYFKGSDSKVDWRNNFAFWKKPYKDMKNPYRVHGGFMKCWKQVEDIVIEKIADPRWQRIITVGYSHGGALAAFCQECVWYHRPDIRDNCWGLGYEAPRIYAGLWFRKKLRARWKNFIVFRNRNDIVTHVPPRCFGFWHVGSVVKIAAAHPLRCLKEAVRALFKKEWGKMKDALLDFVGVDAHYQSEVIKGLEEWEETEEAKALAAEIWD